MRSFFQGPICKLTHHYPLTHLCLPLILSLMQACCRLHPSGWRTPPAVKHLLRQRLPSPARPPHPHPLPSPTTQSPHSGQQRHLGGLRVAAGRSLAHLPATRADAWWPAGRGLTTTQNRGRRGDHGDASSPTQIEDGDAWSHLLWLRFLSSGRHPSYSTSWCPPTTRSWPLAGCGGLR
jgi:hypothetical protein